MSYMQHVLAKSPVGSENDPVCVYVHLSM